MKKIKSFLTVFLSVLLLVNATSLNLINANDGDTSDVSQEGQNQNIEGKQEEMLKLSPGSKKILSLILCETR